MPAFSSSRTGRRAGSPARRPNFYTWLGAKLPLIGFALRFLGWLGVFYGLSLTDTHEIALRAYRSGLASAAGVLLRGAGEVCVVAGESIASSTASVIVTDRCSALGLFWLLGSVVLAYPAKWGARFLGVFAGALVITVINVVRVGTLFWTSDHHPLAFDAVHETLWPALLVIAVATFLSAWIALLPREA